MKTRVSEILGIKYPIIQGGMVLISTPQLAAAVSNAGGLGQLTCIIGNRDAATLRANISATRALTDKPFGVNIPLMMPGAETFIETSIAEGVDVIITSAGNPAKFTGRIKDNGIKSCHVVPSVKMGKKAQDAGVDFIIAEGWEAGGHNSFDDVTTMTLIPQIVHAITIPVVAAGGIADARTAAAAFVLGAEGIQMGTRFLMTKECIAHDNYKRAIINSADTSTVITGRKLGPVRMLKNQLASQILTWENQSLATEEILGLIGRGRSEKALLQGDMEEGSPMSGQVAGLITEVISVSEVFDRIVGNKRSILLQTANRLDIL